MAPELSELLRTEYAAIKGEQVHRIAFRDNMLFVQLAVTGAISSWVATNLKSENAVYALLLIPWTCWILGWTYVINDYAVSRIGKYIREVIEVRLRHLQPPRAEVIEGDGATFEIPVTFGWETFHRTDARRLGRKRIQLVTDLIAFVVPGISAIAVFFALGKKPFGSGTIIVAILELILLVALTYTIWVYADLQRGVRKER